MFNKIKVFESLAIIRAALGSAGSLGMRKITMQYYGLGTSVPSKQGPEAGRDISVSILCKTKDGKRLSLCI